MIFLSNQMLVHHPSGLRFPPPSAGFYLGSMIGKKMQAKINYSQRMALTKRI